jgi:hypothetical protein
MWIVAQDAETPPHGPREVSSPYNRRLRLKAGMDETGMDEKGVD